MTLLECLQKMDDIWFYLYENPTKDKNEAYYELKLAWDMNGCPCCEYASQQARRGGKRMCNFCPLKDYWPEGDCMAKKESAYLTWNNTDDLEIKANAAAEICCVANMKYFELKDKEV